MILVFFEKWTPTRYVSTHLMGLDEDGKITHPLVTSSYNFRIPFADEVHATTDGTAVFYSGDGKNLVRYEIGPPNNGITPTSSPTSKKYKFESRFEKNYKSESIQQ